MDAYGQTVASLTSGLKTSWRYQGRLDISPTSDPLYANGARLYSPSLGTFTSLDTTAGKATSPLSMNRFLYAEANPATFIDPSGHCVYRDGGLQGDDCSASSKGNAVGGPPGASTAGTVLQFLGGAISRIGGAVTEGTNAYIDWLTKKRTGTTEWVPAAPNSGPKQGEWRTVTQGEAHSQAEWETKGWDTAGKGLTALGKGLTALGVGLAGVQIVDAYMEGGVKGAGHKAIAIGAGIWAGRLAQTGCTALFGVESGGAAAIPCMGVGAAVGSWVQSFVEDPASAIPFANTGGKGGGGGTFDPGEPAFERGGQGDSSAQSIGNFGAGDAGAGGLTLFR